MKRKNCITGCLFTACYNTITLVCVSRRGAGSLWGVQRLELWADCGAAQLFSLLLLLYLSVAHHLHLFFSCPPRSFAWTLPNLPALLFFFPPHLLLLRPRAAARLLPPPGVASRGRTAACPGPQTHVPGEGDRRGENPALCPAMGHVIWGRGSGPGDAHAVAKLGGAQEEDGDGSVTSSSFL